MIIEYYMPVAAFVGSIAAFYFWIKLNDAEMRIKVLEARLRWAELGEEVDENSLKCGPVVTANDDNFCRTNDDGSWADIVAPYGVDLNHIQITCATDEELKRMVKNMSYTSYYRNQVQLEQVERRRKKG